MCFINMLDLHDGGFNFVIALPAVVVLVAVVLLLKLNARRNSASSESQRQEKIASKHKNEKRGVHKKEKLNNEVKTLSSNPTKTLKTSGDTVKSNTNKKLAVNTERSPKTNVHTKKQQVHNNTQKSWLNKNYQINKKHLESFVNNDEDGEWQMVTTKKQKQTRQGQPVDANTAKLNKKSLNSPDKLFKLINKTKKLENVDDKGLISAQIVNSKTTPPEIIQVVGGGGEASNSNCQQNSSSVLDYHASDKLKNNINTTNLTTEVAFYEMDDDGWTDTKPQKKNRGKALRE